MLLYGRHDTSHPRGPAPQRDHTPAASIALSVALDHPRVRALSMHWSSGCRAVRDRGCAASRPANQSSGHRTFPTGRRTSETVLGPCARCPVPRSQNPEPSRPNPASQASRRSRLSGHQSPGPAPATPCTKVLTPKGPRAKNQTQERHALAHSWCRTLDVGWRSLGGLG